jgi:3-hydroxybutyryl-CoA dehydrogenase
MIIVIAEGESFKSIAGPSLDEVSHQYIWLNNAREFPQYAHADVFIDFGFTSDFFSPPGTPLLINETNKTFAEIENCPAKVARFCAWPGFLERPVLEIASTGANSEWLGPIMAAVGKNFEIVADLPGLVAPKILSMIINEACFALSENISSSMDIDIAMQLGTNYPEGPLAWGKKIGAGKINDLLTKLSKVNSRYSPHPLLLKHLA